MVKKNRPPVIPGRIPPPFRGTGCRLIDPGIRYEVRILWGNGIETSESCQGGRGHPFPEKTVRFHGNASEGFKALAIALTHGLKVSTLRRYYTMTGGELTGPDWEMTFWR
jgi:hypothetical protein